MFSALQHLTAACPAVFSSGMVPAAATFASLAAASAAGLRAGSMAGTTTITTITTTTTRRVRSVVFA
ncbi:hypothetical protein [Stenotrophomonas sp. SORGH_AS_0321]|uniref:hypothetical protein n=1 Tax=Stenotrophomonas sp. SORGH_AS_0321 TaxID=3041787 RepID=UPI002854242D|nr:hypothetical protein [Stenotrophomonas sp. SORGH_AS_0321]MDR6094746.1 hypothetical protein [Stenotrophomonas sp. SORGH_AS_0321]